MREFELIDKLQRVLKSSTKNTNLKVGIGDDCAVSAPSRDFILSTVDCLVEGVHFDLKYMSPQELGRKAISVSVSDIAAMGGKPEIALVSLGLSPNLSEKLIIEVYSGIRSAAMTYGIAVAGGNITRTKKDFFIDVTLLGNAKKPILRSKAKIGDLLVTTGPTGLSGCGLALLQKFGRSAKKRFPLATEKHLRPKARVLEANCFSKHKGVNALIDISDGLSSELAHLSAMSKVGVEIEESLLPVSSELRKAAILLKKNPLDWILNGGEDYELLAAIDAKKADAIFAAFRRKGLRLFPIGKLVPQRQGLRLLSQQSSGTIRTLPLHSKGWTHF